MVIRKATGKNKKRFVLIHEIIETVVDGEIPNFRRRSGIVLRFLWRW